ncbi:rieske ferredoxin [Dorcoceras hygrometricum]|uniref:Rieske ferredoxin n=1 Tax=Dorcoceras hygrometricum TaxID=472368 RepID=A0A2Z6ZWT4_9LAMI|nr:rieske ferredoxin [Dorcoceras hygrometricum]
MCKLNQQLRISAPAYNSLQKGYRMEELLESSPTLPQTPKIMVGNDGNSPEKLTVNSTRVRETEVDNYENFTKYGICRDIQNGVAATNPNGSVSNLSKCYRFALNNQNKAAVGYKHAKIGSHQIDHLSP